MRRGPRAKSLSPDGCTRAFDWQDWQERDTGAHRNQVVPCGKRPAWARNTRSTSRHRRSEVAQSGKAVADWSTRIEAGQRPRWAGVGLRHTVQQRPSRVFRNCVARPPRPEPNRLASHPAVQTSAPAPSGSWPAFLAQAALWVLQARPQQKGAQAARPQVVSQWGARRSCLHNQQALPATVPWMRIPRKRMMANGRQDCSCHDCAGGTHRSRRTQQVRQLYSRLNVHFVENSRTVDLHRAHAYIQAVGNQLIGQTFDHTVHDIPFSLG